jgi:signal peptidase I
MIDTYLMFIVLISIVIIFYRRAIKLPSLAKSFVLTGDEKLLGKYDRGRLADILSTALPVAVLCLVMKTFLFDVINIPSESMLPAYPVGTMAIVNKSEFGVRSPLTYKSMSEGRYPEHGETVVTRFPLNPDILYIKRVIALPGDELSLSKEGLKINNEVFPVVYSKDDTFTIKGEELLHSVYSVAIKGRKFEWIVDKDKEFPNITRQVIPKDSFFVLGDNLTASADSRSFGVVPWHYFIGSVLKGK